MVGKCARLGTVAFHMHESLCNENAADGRKDKGLESRSEATVSTSCADIPVNPAGKKDVFASACAVAALVIYLFTQLFFRFGYMASLVQAFVGVDFLTMGECAALSLALCTIVLRQYYFSTARFALSCLSLAVIICSAMLTGLHQLVHAFIFLLAFSGEDRNRLCRAYFLVTVAALVILVALSLCGLITNRDIIPNDRLVFSYGFVHPNACAAVIINALCAAAYILWERRDWAIVVVLALMSAAFSYWALSARAGTVLCLALAIACLVGHLKKPVPTVRNSKKIFIFVLVGIPSVLLVAMLLSCVFFDATNPLFALLNKLTNARPHFAHSYFVRNGGFTIFGRPYVTTNYYHSGLPFQNLDSGYCYLPLVYGVATMAILFSAYVAIVVKGEWGRRRFIAGVLILLSAAYMTVESFGLNLATCFPMLLLMTALGCKAESGYLQNDTHDGLRGCGGGFGYVGETNYPRPNE